MGCPKDFTRPAEFADISLSPVPDYHLLSVKDYAFMNIQVSRGCPYSPAISVKSPHFWEHKVRMKNTSTNYQ